jgi:hypothetical protein
LRLDIQEHAGFQTSNFALEAFSAVSNTFVSV